MYNPSLNVGAPYFHDTTRVQKDVYAPMVMKEDTADIDILLSLDGEDGDEEDEVSTARTIGNDTSDTSDSCSSRLRDSGPGSVSYHESNGSDRKREKMRKMVKSLKRIMPGGNQRMNTVDVLDEAVKYLKSLKVEAHKVGVGHMSG